MTTGNTSQQDQSPQDKAREEAQQALGELQARYSQTSSSSKKGAISQEDKAIDKEVQYRGKGANNFYQVFYQGNYQGRINRDNTKKGNSFYFLLPSEVEAISQHIKPIATLQDQLRAEGRDTTDKENKEIVKHYQAISKVETTAKARGRFTQRGAGVALVKANS